jgi:hypothetical protein
MSPSDNSEDDQGIPLLSLSAAANKTLRIRIGRRKIRIRRRKCREGR